MAVFIAILLVAIFVPFAFRGTNPVAFIIDIILVIILCNLFGC